MTSTLLIKGVVAVVGLIAIAASPKAAIFVLIALGLYLGIS